MKVNFDSASHITLVSFLVQIICNAKGNDEKPEVVTSVGTIRGVRATDGNYTKFVGIPFARVNESNPFGESLPYPNFDDIFEAFHDDISCPHREEFNFTVVGSLDCLIVNIYVPDSATPENPLPVMIYIFGGRFMLGSPNDFFLGPKFLMEHDVIFVKVNYRLGPYGFTCLHAPEAAGNQGLRDQLQGMRWVKEHIAAFGGDPNKITLFGNSAGAMSIDYHLLSEVEPLYHNVILQSGTAFVEPLAGANPSALLNLARYLGLNTNDTTEAMDYIKSFDSHTVIQASVDNDIVAFKPCIETEIKGIKTIISDNSVNLSAPKAKDVKIMIGSNDDEYLYYFATIEPELYPFLDSFFRDTLEELFSFGNKMLEEAEKMVRNFYIGDANVSADVILEVADFYSDIFFIHGTERTIKQYLQSGAQEIYYYVFTYSGGRGYMQIKTSSNLRGAYHADELGYLFDMGLIRDKVPSPEDQLIIDRMTTMWTNFATYGNPIPEPSDLLPVSWEPITQGSAYHYMNITTDMNTGRKPFNQRMAFWDLFYEAYGQYERARFRVPRTSAASISVFSFYLVLVVLLQSVFSM